MTKVFQTSKYCSRTMGITDCRTTTYAKNPSVNVAKMKVRLPISPLVLGHPVCSSLKFISEESHLNLVFNSPRGVLPNFQYREVHVNIWGLKFYVNQYLASVYYNMDKDSISRVHKSERRKNRGIWCGSPKYWTQYLGSPKR